MVRKFYTLKEMAKKIGVKKYSLAHGIHDPHSKFYGLRYERDAIDDYDETSKRDSRKRSRVLFPKESADYWLAMYRDGWMCMVGKDETFGGKE